MTKWKDRLFVFWRQNTCTDEFLDDAITAHTLRRVVAMVKRLEPETRVNNPLTPFEEGEQCVCDYILAALQRMKDGTR